VKCHTFITESTFGLPIYRWKPQEEVLREINQWWAENKANGKVSMLAAYALGKAQRLLHGLDPSLGKIYTHGAVENTNRVLRKQGVALPDTIKVAGNIAPKEFIGSLVIAPPSAIGSNWISKFRPLSIGIASGWMALRGTRRRRAADRGFVLSDHADWEGLNDAITATGAERVIVTHGYTGIFSKWLKEERGIQAVEAQTEYEGESLDSKDEEKES
jgi:putative mRNA 3-end processing factor